eukprot:TRINITY_DN1178_c0_g2_i1.p1 TRINITY_DN1178_c0_g2~~TRINITY_DN1178_c0_g2_i1.p1  ORF type:complete len:657 (-),score=91.07 TRINITY_DN1178_c0_g2_i1:85-2055(-)
MMNSLTSIVSTLETCQNQLPQKFFTISWQMISAQIPTKSRNQNCQLDIKIKLGLPFSSLRILTQTKFQRKSMANNSSIATQLPQQKKSKDLIKSSKNFYFKVIKNPNRTQIDAQLLYQYFSQFGTIVSIKLAYTKSQEFAEYGYVSFKDDSLLSIPDADLTKLVEKQGQSLTAKFGEIEIRFQLFQDQKIRQSEAKTLHMLDFTNEIPEEEINVLKTNKSKRDAKEKEYQQLIESILSEFSTISIIVHINFENKKPQVFINDIKNEDIQDQIKNKLESQFKVFKPNIVKPGKSVSIILYGIKKDIDIGKFIKVIEDEFGKIKKVKQQDQTLKISQTKAPDQSSKFFTIFAFVDQKNNDKFLALYENCDKLKEFTEKELTINYKMSKKDLNTVKTIKKNAKKPLNPQSQPIQLQQQNQPQQRQFVSIQSVSQSNYQQTLYSPQQQQQIQQLNSLQYYQPNQQFSTSAYSKTNQQVQAYRHNPQQYIVNRPNFNSSQRQGNLYNSQINSHYNKPYPQQLNQTIQRVQPNMIKSQVIVPQQQTPQVQPLHVPQQEQVQEKIEFQNYEQLKAKLQAFMLLPQIQKQQILGKLLYPLIQKQIGAEIAPKITGMLIDFSVFEVSDIFEFFENEQELKDRITEAKELIGKQQQDEKPSEKVSK